MNKIKIRNLLIALFIIVILLFVGYKYFEWKTFSDLSNAYNNSYVKEIKYVSAITPPTNDFFKELYNNKQFGKPKDNQDYLEGLTTISDKLNIVVNNQEGYVDLLNGNVTTFTTLKNSANLLFGERGDVARKIVNDQLAYYSDEIKQANINLASLYATEILFSIYRDNVTVNDFNKVIGSSTSQSDINQYFSEISSLEKYSNSDYKFDKEDFIKSYYPSFVDKIDNWKMYFSSYYKAEKDFSVGNTDIAKLELQAVTDNAYNSYIDYSSLFNEQSSKNTELSKDILKLVSEQASAIKDYKMKGFYKYPLLKSVNVWKEDFVLCQMYNFKTNIFNTITSKYPSAKTVSGLINELSSINPKTDNVDNTFDKSAMKFTNTDNKLEFTCIDKYTGDKVNFTTLKSYATN